MTYDWPRTARFVWALVTFPAMRCAKLGRNRGDCCIPSKTGRPKRKSRPTRKPKMEIQGKVKSTRLRDVQMRSYPYTIDNGHGEQLTFTGVTHGPDGDRAGADGLAQPGAGPPMHVHYL